MKKYEYEALTLEEAKQMAINEIGVDEDFLLIKNRTAKDELNNFKIEVITKQEVLEFVKKFVNDLIKSMNIEANTEINYKNDSYQIIISSEDNSFLIGKEGRTLNALQFLIKQILQKETGHNLKVIVDISGYKAKKQFYFEKNIKKLAHEVLKTGIDTKLDPMNSYDRRLVHNIISSFDNLTSESFGEEPKRYVVISKKD